MLSMSAWLLAWMCSEEWKMLIVSIAVVSNAMWLGIPSCSDDDREFAVQHGLNFVEVYDAGKHHVLNSDEVCHVRLNKLNELRWFWLNNCWYKDMWTILYVETAVCTVITTIGDRAFPVAAVYTWNSLSQHVTFTPSCLFFEVASRLSSSGVPSHDFHCNFVVPAQWQLSFSDT